MSMDVLQAIKERRSIRAFKSDPVSRDKVEEVLRLAALAPSAINLQPWEFTVVIGEERERLSRKTDSVCTGQRQAAPAGGHCAGGAGS
jgi:nitroreductase